jgi:hypothetical protein
VCSSGLFEGGQDWRLLSNPSTLFVGDEGTTGLGIAASCVVKDENGKIIARYEPDRLFTTLNVEGEMNDGKGNWIIAREINSKKVDII